MKKYFRNIQKGFVLTELLVALAIIGMLIVLVGSFTSNIFSLQSYTADTLQQSDELRRLIKQFVREVRTAETSDGGEFMIAYAGTSTFTFYTDTDGNASREKVRYFIEGTTLKRAVTVSSGVPPIYSASNERVYEVAHMLASSTIFSYFPKSYTGTEAALSAPATPTEVRLVKLRISVDPDPGRIPGPVVEETQVSIRNLKDNL